MKIKSRTKSQRNRSITLRAGSSSAIVALAIRFLSRGFKGNALAPTLLLGYAVTVAWLSSATVLEDLALPRGEIGFLAVFMLTLGILGQMATRLRRSLSGEAWSKTLVMVCLFAIAAKLSYDLFAIWHSLPIAILSWLAVIELWAVVDREAISFSGFIIRLLSSISTTLKSFFDFLSSRFDEAPPTALIMYALIILMTCAVAIGTSYNFANFLATYAFYLLVVGVVGQLISVIRRGSKNNAE